VKIVLDTNIYISALLTEGGISDRLYQQWRNRRFTLYTSQAQLTELRRVSRYSKLKGLLKPAQVGALVNLLKEDARIVNPRVIPNYSPDPDDNAILAIALEAKADYLASLDLGDVLSLKKVGKTKVVSARGLIGRLDK
jgi:putative PIN family toxin of toxin-antitoxin system